MGTGQGNCTYHVEDAGELDIDELVGIKPRWSSRAEFCRQCKTEGGLWKNGGCGLHFWDDMMDKRKGAERVQKAREAFNKKYPHMPPDESLLAPPCDFNQKKYGFATGPDKSQAEIRGVAH